MIREIVIEIKGTSPLLMNNPKSMLEPKELVRKTTKEHDYPVEAEKLAYRTEKKQLYVPSTAIKGSIINASSWKKAGKLALKPLIAGGIRIPTPELILDTQKYEIDLRTVVIQRQRVIKARPMIKQWKLEFSIHYNADLIADPDIIKQCLQEAGERVGILDFRPQKSGEFGCFEITKWEVKK